MSKTLFGLALVSILVLPGCGLFQLNGPHGSSPGMIVGNTTYASALNPATTHEINIARSDIELLGRVESSAESFTVLGMVGQGDSGYQKLLDAARAKGAEGIMNVTIDNKVEWYVFGAYVKVTTTLTGVAYKYK